MKIIRYARTDMCEGLIDFFKDDKNNCTTCEYGIKKLFRKKYTCGYTLGLNLDNGLYGRCRHYEKNNK